MTSRIARVWNGSEWESLTSETPSADAIVSYQSLAPSAPETGQLWIDSDDRRIHVWSGSSWLATSDLQINTKTDSYTLTLQDSGKLLKMDKATAQTLTVPTNASEAFPIGSKIDVVQTGAGEVTISPESGVTINSEGSKLKINAQWQAVSLVKIDTDVWVLIGAIKA